MPPQRNLSSSNPIPTPPVIPPEPPFRSMNELTHQSAASGSTKPYTPDEETQIPPGLLACQWPAPEESDIEPGEHDKGATVEVRMAIIWHMERIMNQTHHTQIIAKAWGLVADFVEGHGKYKETPAKARDDMVVAMATGMANISEATTSHWRAQPSDYMKTLPYRSLTMIPQEKRWPRWKGSIPLLTKDKHIGKLQCIVLTGHRTVTM